MRLLVLKETPNEAFDNQIIFMNSLGLGSTFQAVKYL